MGLDVQKIGINNPTTATKINKKNDKTFTNKPTDNSSTNLALGMTTIAATAIAGVALYKNHNMQKELNSALEKITKTENELQKVIEESKNNIKSTIETVIKSENKESNNINKGIQNTTKKSYSGSWHTNANDNNRQRNEENNAIDKLGNTISDGLKILENDEAEARKAKKASDRRNQEWLEQQHKQKEQEYSAWWNKTLFDKEAKEGERILDEDVAEIRKAKKASDRRNQEWLEQQHKQKEQEYSTWLNKTLLEQETKEGERILDEDVATLNKKKKISDIRNQRWIDEQHKQKEQEINQFFSDNSDKLDELEQLADKRIRTKYEVLLDEEAKKERFAKKASDMRNQEWLDKQHKIKEQEMNEFYAKRSRKLKQLSKLADKRLREKYEAILDKETATKLQLKNTSDKRNQEWLDNQHKLKEQEYSNWWNKTLFDREAKEGQKVLEKDADAEIKAKNKSDKRNQQWLNEQHKIKEQEMNQFFSDNADKLDKLEQLADARLADKYEKLLKNARLEEANAKKNSDKRNQKWLDKQHKLKEQEYSNWWNKILFDKEAKEGERILEADIAETRKAKKASDRRNQEWLAEQHKIKEQEMNERYEYNDIEIQYIYFKAKVKNYIKSLFKRLFSKNEN